MTTMISWRHSVQFCTSELCGWGLPLSLAPEKSSYNTERVDNLDSWPALI
jgi:hypothetical protein